MTDRITDLLIKAMEAARAKDEAHKAVWADPTNKALIPALQAAMVEARNTRKAYGEASGRAFDAHGAFDTMQAKAERIYNAAMDQEI